jgi:competence protein ComEA
MEKHQTKIRAGILILSAALFSFYLVQTPWKARPPAGETSAPVVVEIKGDVPKPGIYTVDGPRATVASLAATAGCSPQIPDDVAHRRLTSGQCLEILRQDNRITVRFGRMPGAALLAMGLKLDLNSASLDELLLIPRMQAGIAAAIVERRREKQWESVGDLIEIRGVGEKTVKRLQDYLEITHHEKQPLPPPQAP